MIMLIGYAGCIRSGGYHTLRGTVWNTLYHVTYLGSPSLEDSIRKTLDEVGASLSAFDPESRLSHVNSLDTAAVDAHFRRVFEVSEMVSALSGGMFDPTLGPLIDAWGFGSGHKITPDTSRLDSLLLRVGLDRCRLHGDTLFKPRGLRFNFSAVAKGYGCDAIADMLKRNGVEDFLVEIGGEAVCSGHSPRGVDWRIAVEAPDSLTRESENPYSQVLVLSGRGVATSGNYRNFHDVHGHRLGHIISPVTGHPAETDILSATVVAPTSAEADALATAAMAMGSERAAAMLGKGGYTSMLVTVDTVIFTNWSRVH